VTRTVATAVALISLLAFAAAGCGSDPNDAASGGTGAAASSDGGEEIHWSYDGDEGPARWGALSDEFEACESGAEQSPINIEQAAVEPADIPDPVINWRTSDLEIVNNGHTIQANVPEGSTTTLGGTEYQLLQFHWHRPSENTVDGDPYAMELHFVSADEEGNLAVLATLIEEGDANPLYDTLWNAQPEEGGTQTIEGVDFTQLLPDDMTTWTFQGSLTTPPCSEGLSWNVLATPATMSAEQVGAFLYDGNARPVQPINDRTIDGDTTED
jgi:carbonic anhydrase